MHPLNPDLVVASLVEALNEGQVLVQFLGGLHPDLLVGCVHDEALKFLNLLSIDVVEG